MGLVGQAAAQSALSKPNSLKRQKQKRRIPINKIVLVRVEDNAMHLRRLRKATGGKWNKEKLFWEIPYGSVKTLGFEERVIPP